MGSETCCNCWRPRILRPLPLGCVFLSRDTTKKKSYFGNGPKQIVRVPTVDTARSAADAGDIVGPIDGLIGSMTRVDKWPLVYEYTPATRLHGYSAVLDDDNIYFTHLSNNTMQNICIYQILFPNVHHGFALRSPVLPPGFSDVYG